METVVSSGQKRGLLKVENQRPENVRQSFVTILPSKAVENSNGIYMYPYLGKKAKNGKHVHCHCFNEFMLSYGYNNYITNDPSEAILQAYYLAEKGFASIQNLNHGEGECKSDLAIVVIPQITDEVQEMYFEKIQDSLQSFENLVVTTGGLVDGKPCCFDEIWIDTRTLEQGDLIKIFRSLQIQNKMEQEKPYEKKLA